MKINKKKFIYLISPNNIYPQFYQDLNKILETRKVGLFQLRLKKYSFKKKILIKGAGRTDSGVHEFRQSASFSSEVNIKDKNKFIN